MTNSQNNQDDVDIWRDSTSSGPKPVVIDGNKFAEPRTLNSGEDGYSDPEEQVNSTPIAKPKSAGSNKKMLSGAALLVLLLIGLVFLATQRLLPSRSAAMEARVEAPPRIELTSQQPVNVFDSMAQPLEAAPSVAAPAQVQVPAQVTTVAKPEGRVSVAGVASVVEAPKKPASQPKPRAAAQVKRKAPTEPVQSATRPTRADPVAEVQLLPSGMKVQSVYPPVGPDVQAWVRDPSSGRTSIVRVGDSLHGLFQVIKIDAERGEVTTNAGVITTSGVR